MLKVTRPIDDNGCIKYEIKSFSDIDGRLLETRIIDSGFFEELVKLAAVRNAYYQGDKLILPWDKDTSINDKNDLSLQINAGRTEREAFDISDFPSHEDYRDIFKKNNGWYREIFSSMVDWAKLKNAYPLLLSGTRRTGKTYLLNRLGECIFKQYYYIDVSDAEMRKLYHDAIDRVSVYADRSKSDREHSFYAELFRCMFHFF